MEVRTDSAGGRLHFARFVPGWHDRMVPWVAARAVAGPLVPVAAAEHVGVGLAEGKLLSETAGKMRTPEGVPFGGRAHSDGKHGRGVQVPRPAYG